MSLITKKPPQNDNLSKEEIKGEDSSYYVLFIYWIIVDWLFTIIYKCTPRISGSLSTLENLFVSPWSFKITNCGTS